MTIVLYIALFCLMAASVVFAAYQFSAANRWRETAENLSRQLQHFVHGTVRPASPTSLTSSLTFIITCMAVGFVIALSFLEISPLRQTPRQTTLAAKQGNASPVAAQNRDNKNQEAVTRPESSNMQQWMPAILALFGSLLVVVVTAWLNTKALSSQMDALRAEMRQGFAEFRLEVIRETLELRHRVEDLERR